MFIPFYVCDDNDRIIQIGVGVLITGARQPNAAHPNDVVLSFVRNMNMLVSKPHRVLCNIHAPLVETR